MCELECGFGEIKALTDYVTISDSGFYCGKLTGNVAYFTDRDWSNKLKGKPGEVILALYISDEDDFGGAVFYSVPEYDLQKYADMLYTWLLEVRNNGEENYDFYCEETFPAFDGINRYINW